MASAPPALEGLVRLPDGRRLAWSSAGPPDGLPVVYLHAAIGTPLRASVSLHALTNRLNVRHIAVSRPGFGQSDACPGRRLVDFTADIERLADRLRLGRFAVIGVSAGGPYAIACAHALGDRVPVVAAVSSLSPLGPPHAGRAMPAHLRLALRVLVRHPHLAERAGGSLLRFLECHPRAVARLARTGARGSDRDLLAAEDVGGAAVESFLAAAGGGVRGMIDDYVICCSSWGFDPGDVRGEVHVWHGEQDRFVPVEQARALARALPCCRSYFDADDGHFFFQRRLAQVLEELVAATQRLEPAIDEVAA